MNNNYLILEDAVLKNKADIENIKASRAEMSLGIKLVGEIEDVSSLPDPLEYKGEYGDCYKVGGGAATYYIFTRPTNETSENHWVNIGGLQIAGPQGPAGDSIEYIASKETGTVIENNITKTKNTVTCTMSDGREIAFEVITNARRGANGAPGIQGVQGIKGDKGDKGEKGDVGPQGEMGPTTPAYHIIGTVSSTSQLPFPSVLKDVSAAYIVEENNVKKLYIQIGKTLDDTKWTYLGDLSAANYWELSNNILAPVETVDTVQINNLAVLKSASLVSPSISGIASVSGLHSPATMNIQGVNGINLVVGEGENAKTAISIASDGTISGKGTISGNDHVFQLRSRGEYYRYIPIAKYDSEGGKITFRGACGAYEANYGAAHIDFTIVTRSGPGVFGSIQTADLEAFFNKFNILLTSDTVYLELNGWNDTNLEVSLNVGCTQLDYAHTWSSTAPDNIIWNMKNNYTSSPSHLIIN